MIRLAFGSAPRKVVVRLGKTNPLTPMKITRPKAVSCVWDARFRTRPRRLALATRGTASTTPRMNSYHGRYLYA
ncbi:hypothetical protein DND132_2305 [Pseudodesulfovibrio mercurii]|uniref:Uncharacterized protein n=1 Tax=Pseudodesulfovibrio mercurii TaxID=641491 RepID=F0JBK6_9BACT|nr:hypothetical protein DND132_2305 [Pseudodesulfovibrio mercurii]